MRCYFCPKESSRFLASGCPGSGTQSQLAVCAQCADLERQYALRFPDGDSALLGHIASLASALPSGQSIEISASRSSPPLCIQKLDRRAFSVSHRASSVLCLLGASPPRPVGLYESDETEPVIAARYDLADGRTIGEVNAGQAERCAAALQKMLRTLASASERPAVAVRHRVAA